MLITRLQYPRCDKKVGIEALYTTPIPTSYKIPNIPGYFYSKSFTYTQHLLLTHSSIPIIYCTGAISTVFSSFKVFTPKIKYRIWNAHTNPRTILPTGTLLIIINPIDIRIVTVSMTRIFIAQVIPRPCT